MDEELYYRYRDQCYAPSLDEWENPIGESRKVILLEIFRVKSHTPKGVWLQWKIGPWTSTEKKFVLHNARKKFAHPTRNEALESFIARKTKQKKILSAQLRTVESFLNLAKDKEKLLSMEGQL